MQTKENYQELLKTLTKEKNILFGIIKFLYETIRDLSRRKSFYLHILVQRPSFKFVVNKHTAIFEAIKANNEAVAEDMMRSHLDFYVSNIGNVSI